MSGSFLCCILCVTSAPRFAHALLGSVIVWNFYSQKLSKRCLKGGGKGMTVLKREPYKRSMMMLQGQPQGCTCTRQTRLKSTFCQGRSPGDSYHWCKRGWFLHHPSWPRNSSPFLQGSRSTDVHQATTSVRIKVAAVQIWSLNRNI